MAVLGSAREGKSMGWRALLKVGNAREFAQQKKEWYA
jgi:hypothetical protein